mgnify:CR=1 FL=1
MCVCLHRRHPHYVGQFHEFETKQRNRARRKEKRDGARNIVPVVVPNPLFLLGGGVNSSPPPPLLPGAAPAASPAASPQPSGGGPSASTNGGKSKSGRSSGSGRSSTGSRHGSKHRSKNRDKSKASSSGSGAPPVDRGHSVPALSPPTGSQQISGASAAGSQHSTAPWGQFAPSESGFNDPRSSMQADPSRSADGSHGANQFAGSGGAAAAARGPFRGRAGARDSSPGAARHWHAPSGVGNDNDAAAAAAAASHADMMYARAEAQAIYQQASMGSQYRNEQQMPPSYWPPRGYHPQDASAMNAMYGGAGQGPSRDRLGYQIPPGPSNMNMDGAFQQGMPMPPYQHPGHLQGAPAPHGYHHSRSAFPAHDPYR